MLENLLNISCLSKVNTLLRCYRYLKNLPCNLVYSAKHILNDEVADAHSESQRDSLVQRQEWSCVNSLTVAKEVTESNTVVINPPPGLNAYFTDVLYILFLKAWYPSESPQIPG